MVHKKCGKCAGHDAYYGVMFQNFAKQTLCMLDAVTVQDSSDFGTHKPTTPFPDFCHFECHRKPNNLNIIISNPNFFFLGGGRINITLRVQTTCQCLSCVIELFKVLEFNTENNKKVKAS